MDDQKKDAQSTEPQVITPSNAAAPVAPAQNPPTVESQVIKPTDVAAPEGAVEVPQIRAQSGGAEVVEDKLSNPLYRIIFWLFSGFAVLFVAILFNVILTLLFGKNLIVDILSYIIGLAGIVLLFVGPYKAVKIFLQNK